MSEDKAKSDEVRKVRNCTICESCHLDRINDLIHRQTPYRQIETECKDIGFDVSYVTIKKHADKCLPDYEGRQPDRASTKHKEKSIQVDPERIKAAIEKTKNFPDSMIQMLRATILSQLEIIMIMQEANKDGARGNPTEEIKALNNLIDIAQKITSTRLGSKIPLNILDFDSVLEPNQFTNLDAIVNEMMIDSEIK